MPGYLKAASFCPVFRKRARCCFQQSDGFSKGARKNDKRYTESNEPVTPTECSESLWMLRAAGKPSYCLGTTTWFWEHPLYIPVLKAYALMICNLLLIFHKDTKKKPPSKYTYM